MFLCIFQFFYMYDLIQSSVVCCDAIDHGECWDKQHHQDCWSSVQREIHESRVDAEAALWTHDDHDWSGPRWITYQRTSHQLHSSQLAWSSQTELPGRIHNSSCQGACLDQFACCHIVDDKFMRLVCWIRKALFLLTLCDLGAHVQLLL